MEKNMKENLTVRPVKECQSCQGCQCGESPRSSASSGMYNKEYGSSHIQNAGHFPMALCLVIAPSKNENWFYFSQNFKVLGTEYFNHTYWERN